MIIIKLTNNINIVVKQDQNVSYKISSLNGDLFECTEEETFKYIKLIYGSFDVFNKKIIQKGLKEAFLNEEIKKSEEDILKYIEEKRDALTSIEPFSYAEAFNIKIDEFRGLVFNSISVSDMLEELGHTRYKVDGITLTQKKYDKEGNLIDEVEQSNVYEVHEVDGAGLGLNQKLYAVKCWCTSTNKEHWLWIEEQYKDDPLEAIASTFRVHKSIIPHIKCLKRQGDILLAELSKDITPKDDDEIIPLTKEQYFEFLNAQS